MLPSNNEWVKAAYYDPKHGGTDSYWAYPAGTPRVLLRFTVTDSSETDENQAARLAAVHARDAVDEIADTGQLWVLRRRGGRWLPLG